MAQPVPYALTYDFVGYQTINPRLPLPADKLEVEFNNITTTLDQILANLALIQRDDTEVANRTIDHDQLTDEFEAEIRVGIRPPTAWATDTDYSEDDTVFFGSNLYRATLDHTSDVFATDLAALKWVFIATFGGGGGGGALGDLDDVTITAAATGQFLKFDGAEWINSAIAQSDVTGLVAALAALQPLDSDLTAIAALSTTAYGRSLLTLANAAALAAEVDSFFLTPTEGNAAYQPLDGDLTAIAALSTAAYGRSLLTLANATALAAEVDSFFLTPTEGNAAYQPLDSDLTSWAGVTRASGFDTFATTPTSANLAALVTDDVFSLSDIELGALAGLTSAADKLPYFTGSGTAALADLSSSMRTFMTTPSSANLAALISDDLFSLSDIELGALAGLTSAADRLPYFTGSGTASLATFTAFARSILDDADEATFKATVNLEIGTDVQAFHARLADIAGITYAQGDIFYYDGANIVKLAAGTNGHFLKTQGAGANPTWAAIAGGGDLLAANNLSDVTNAATAFANIKQAASTTATGVVELLTNSELLTGTDTTRAATADAIAALWEAGSDNTGGATITMGDGGYFNLITSTTAITAFAFTDDKAGRRAHIRFNTARTLTHNATSLIIPGGASVTTAAGDICGIRSLGSGNFVVEWYTKADGTPLVTASAWTFVNKTSDTTRNTTTTTSADPALQFSMAANTTYRIIISILYTSTAAGDFKYGLAGPASPTEVYGVITPGGGVTAGTSTFTAYPTNIDMTQTANGQRFYTINLVVENGANSGTFSFDWAQNTSDAGPTTVKAGSYIEYRTY